MHPNHLRHPHSNGSQIQVSEGRTIDLGRLGTHHRASTRHDERVGTQVKALFEVVADHHKRAPIANAGDQAIEELVQYFSEEEEDTVIVFFGDHQPTDSVINPILKLNGTTSSALSPEEEAGRYQVPFFIWANYDIEEESGLNISANYLASRTLDAAGLPKPGYFSFLTELEKQVPVISANHVSLSDGTFSAADEQDGLLNEYRTFQYYQLFE